MKCLFTQEDLVFLIDSRLADSTHCFLHKYVFRKYGNSRVILLNIQILDF